MIINIISKGVPLINAFESKSKASRENWHNHVKFFSRYVSYNKKYTTYLNHYMIVGHACNMGVLNVIEPILNKGLLNVNDHNNVDSGFTLLHYAVRQKQYDVVNK